MSEAMNGDASGPGGSGKRPSHLRAVKPPPPLPAERSVSERHLKGLVASGLSSETLEMAKLYTELDHKALALLMQKRQWPASCGSALVFPFYLPGTDEPYAYRVRPTSPRSEKRGNKTRLVKYEQPAGSDTYVYFAPRARLTNAYQDTARTLLWTEGEKKALAIDQLHIPCIGLTGVYNWADAKHKQESGEWRLHPTIVEHVTIAGRAHVICFDADAVDNDQVYTAAQRLAGVLLAAGAISVKFVCPPSKEHKGIDDFYAAFGDDVTRALLASPEDIEALSPASPLLLLRKVPALKDAPTIIGDSLRLPEGYEVQRDGSLWKIGDERHGDTCIAPGAVLIGRHLHDYYTHEGRVEICFERDVAGWQTHCVARKAITDARTMVTDLCNLGAPITSNSASKIVDWLESLDRCNKGLIERLASVSRTGWHDLDGERAFVLNEPIFADDDHKRPLALDTRGDRKKMFAALAPRGEFAAHLQALKRAWNADPVAAAVICGVLAATLLEPLGASNFAIHLAGDSSRGKTSKLKIAASVFGDPNNDSWVSSWNTTYAGAEVRAAALDHLPQCYDEVGAADLMTIERMVYMLVNGGGRARSTRELSPRETPSWRTVVVSTGERELADESAATGAQVRVLQFSVTGFGALTAVEIDEIRDQCAANAGAFGREWVEMLLAVEDWTPWRELYRATIKGLRQGSTDSLQGRIASFFGVLVVAEQLAAKLGLGEADGGTMVRLFREDSRREQVLGLADRALALVQDWVLQEPESFPELTPGIDGHDEPKKGSGTKSRHGFKRGNSLLLIGRSLRSFCEGHRLSVREVLREWKLRGWLQVDAGRPFDKAVRIGKSTPHFYYLDVPRESPVDMSEVAP